MFLSSLTSIFCLLSTPPNIDEDLIFTIVFSGTYIFIPPNTDNVFITTSFPILAFLKSHLISPNIAFKSAPENFSLSKLSF